MAEQGSKPKKTPPVSSREKGTSARKRRLDELVVARGLADTRAKAQALIRAGEIFSGARRLDKPGTLVADDVPIERHGGGSDWVSRGGVKLAHGLAHFGLGAAGRVCLDVGASTGGFTQVLLAHGAARVYAVDVGRGQLDWALV
jgi:23S rRNA (cytidine1920-2'-O)/16S rRNA (cytidine1409-2'-O)-methyltransferase